MFSSFGIPKQLCHRNLSNGSVSQKKRLDLFSKFFNSNPQVFWKHVNVIVIGCPTRGHYITNPNTTRDDPPSANCVHTTLHLGFLRAKRAIGRFTLSSHARICRVAVAVDWPGEAMEKWHPGGNFVASPFFFWVLGLTCQHGMDGHVTFFFWEERNIVFFHVGWS